jgi:four helix bundle protein
MMNDEGAARNAQQKVASGEEANSRQFDLEEPLIDFAVQVVELVEALPNTRVCNRLANQLVRCGTSAAPNYAEAEGAESRNDFIHKLRIGLKELRETRVWLLIIRRRSLPKLRGKVEPVLTECLELISIFVASIRTAQRNRGK